MPKPINGYVDLTVSLLTVAAATSGHQHVILILTLECFYLYLNKWLHFNDKITLTLWNLRRLVNYTKFGKFILVWVGEFMGNFVCFLLFVSLAYFYVWKNITLK